MNSFGAISYSNRYTVLWGRNITTTHSIFYGGWYHWKPSHFWKCIVLFWMEIPKIGWTNTFHPHFHPSSIIVDVNSYSPEWITSVIGNFLGITGWDTSVCKSNRLYADILRFSFIKLGYILQIPLKWSVIFLQSWTSTGYFSDSTGSSGTNCRFSLIVGSHSALHEK